MTSVACYMSLVQTVQCVLHRPQEEEEDNLPLTSNVLLVHCSPSSRVKMFECATVHVSGLHCLSKCFSGKLVEYVRTLCSAYNYIKYMKWICFSLVCKQDHDEHHKPHFISNHVLDEKFSQWGTRKPHHQPLPFFCPLPGRSDHTFLCLGWKLDEDFWWSQFQHYSYWYSPDAQTLHQSQPPVVVQPESPLSLPCPVLLRPRCSSVLAGHHAPHNM